MSSAISAMAARAWRSVFQPGAIDRFTVPNRPAGSDPDSGPPILVNAQIAVAR